MLGQKRTKEALEDTLSALDMAGRGLINEDDVFALINRERRNLGLKIWDWKGFNEKIIQPARDSATEKKRQEQLQLTQQKAAEEKKRLDKIEKEHAAEIAKLLKSGPEKAKKKQ